MSQTLTHEPTATEPEHRQHHNVTLAVLVLAAMAYALQQTLVAPAMPAIQDDLGVSTTAVTYLLTAFLLTGSVATPIVGRLGDMFGKKRLMVLTLAVFAAGSLVCALSPSIEVLITGRAIQGVGSAVFPLAFGIIRDEFPRERVAKAVGLLSATFGIGGGVGIVLSGVIVDNLPYAWLFWLGLVVILIALVATLFFIPESPVKAPGKVDWVGAALLSGALIALLVGVSEGNSWGWTDPRTLALFVAAVVLLVVWVRFETGHPMPLVDIAMMRRRTVLTTNLAAILLGFGMFSGFILIPKFVQAPDGAGYGFGSSVTEAGLFMLPSALVMLVAGPVAGWMCGRFGSRVPLLIGSVLVAVAYGFLAVEHSHQISIFLAVALSGLGIGFSFAAMANLIIEAVEPTKTGVAMGMNTIMRTVGGAIGGQVGASILMAHTGESGIPSEAGYTVAFAVLVVSLGAAVLLVLAVPRRGRSAAEAGHPDTMDALAAGVGVPFAGGQLLSGRIRRPDGGAVPAAVLTVIGEDGREIARTRADHAGDYRVQVSGPGRYLLVASHGAHDPHAAEVHVNGHPVELGLVLPQNDLASAAPTPGAAVRVDAP